MAAVLALLRKNCLDISTLILIALLAVPCLLAMHRDLRSVQIPGPGAPPGGVLDAGDPAQYVGKKLVRTGAEATTVFSEREHVLQSSLPPRTRIFTPQLRAGTMDYVPARLNLWVDDADVVVRASYG